ncbi:MAG: hypothetical protein WDN23_15315 [Edaphobacter sp.]
MLGGLFFTISASTRQAQDWIEKLIRNRERVAWAKRSRVRVEGNTLPLSTRATTTCECP